MSRWFARLLGLVRLLGLAAVLGAGAAAAQSPARTCAGPFQIDENTPLRLMRVVASAPRTHFIESRSEKLPSCPSSADACRRRAFVVPGDDVLAGPDQGGFTCVTYIAPDVKQVRGQFAETNGFLPSAALAEVAVSPPAFADWSGLWARSAEAEITIKPWPDGRVWIDGHATFGALDPQRVRRGAINLGTLEGESRPVGHIVPLGVGYDGKLPPNRNDPGDCVARLRLVGRYMLVEDNAGCGGINVSFFGVYVRLKPAP
jgi:hypothetical protein